MKKRWIVSALLVVLATIALVFWNTKPSLQVIDSGQLSQWMTDEQEMVIVDLREPELFEEGRVPNAINIPFAEISEKYSSIPKDKKVVFVCHTGRMGVESGNLLLENGYKDVANLDGGMAKWTGQVES
ncbi:rhodanese-like domain-containing protein [Brevibacillus sp. HB1.2]|uniref:rhodanese-like domain-containing protein n=1 Tax=Brevibacillus sp. HB1.2 TaxID=2738807 RepID=UPI0015757A1F|nr:rhodanese-like domain-containing protein [Brevibacillus sp. HB1.2]NTU19469.1 rhodanese-like domain-containing protein [Brevibacillus sp. HB1.2]